jgi:Uma2 family endonuclease
LWIEQLKSEIRFASAVAAAILSRMSMETLDLEKPLNYEEERGKPMPSFNHAAIQVNLIGEFIRQPDFRVCSELTVEFDGRPYTPDLSVYPRVPLDLRHDVIRRTDPPLVVVEIFSPTQGYQSVMEKVDAYFRNGVKSCWIVSPPLHTITILTPDGPEATVHAGLAKDSATGLTADLAAVFS